MARGLTGIFPSPQISFDFPHWIAVLLILRSIHVSGEQPSDPPKAASHRNSILCDYGKNHFFVLFLLPQLSGQDFVSTFGHRLRFQWCLFYVRNLNNPCPPAPSSMRKVGLQTWLKCSPHFHQKELREEAVIGFPNLRWNHQLVFWKSVDLKPIFVLVSNNCILFYFSLPHNNHSEWQVWWPFVTKLCAFFLYIFPISVGIYGFF